MNNEEKILKYFSDSLTSEEKKNFEEEIENSEELKNEFVKFRESLSELKNISTPEVDENYFVNLTPRIRNKMGKKRKFFTIPKLAFSFSVFAVILVISFNLFNNENKQIIFSLENEKSILNEVLEETPDEQLSDYINFSLNYGSDNFSVLADEIEYDEENLRTIGEKTLKSFNEYELIDNLSDEEADEIYNQLLNTKIL
ncbi:MAG: hypothetical protein A2068_03120 [Ignavibacteria bacterium GWB2_35_6b]|nr:MAG: hypothetical protein A2068_03120 [Ignavibacteria bacterium GWB2_35_6b]